MQNTLYGIKSDEVGLIDDIIIIQQLLHLQRDANQVIY